MRHERWLTAVILAVASLGEARAQIVIYSNPYEYSSYAFGRIVGFGHHHHRLKFGGFYGPVAGYAAGLNQVTIIHPPTIVAAPRVRDPQPDPYDTTGIDLDETDPVTMRPRKHLPARELLPDRPPPPPQKKPQPPPRLPKLKEVPQPEADLNLIDQGKLAFAQREYGLAAQHFRLATLDDPRAALPLFLLAQAQFALGKYRDAVDSIHAGMDRRRDWPTTRFPPRALYKDNDNDFLGHLKRLEDVLETRADDPALLFLLAYELWFDGKPAKARPLFQKAKRFAADPAYINRFLG